MVQTHDPQRDAPVYNIKAVSRLTGVPADTLRRWESRYNILSPQRTEGGYRLYSQRDVDTIQWLKTRLEEGLSISRACEMLRQHGGDPARFPGPPSAPATYLPATTVPTENGVKSFEALRAGLLDAFAQIDEERAASLMTEALSLYSLEDVLLGILQPVLIDVGEGWLKGDITVAAEHFASAFVRTRISNIFHSSHFNPYGPQVLIACAPDEFHELGPMFLAVFLRRAGYKVVYLGQNTPLESLEAMVESVQPDVVCISATRAETAARLYRFRDFLDDLKSRKGHAPMLAFGGQVFNRFPHITERLGGMYLGEDAALAVRRLSETLNASRRAS